jgi:hypothetical protein
MNINEMERKDFEKLPSRGWDEEIICDSLIILPSKINPIKSWIYKLQLKLSELLPNIFKHPEIYELDGMHDSGYRCMDFVACSKREAICLLSGCSDVMHFDGIGGFGENWVRKYGTVPKLIPPSGWSIDCLPKSGLLRVFCDGKIKCSSALSSFEFYAINE